MRIRLATFLVLTCFFAPSGVLSAQTIIGKVLDAVSGDGVGEAEITLRESGGAMAGGAVSEPSGRFVIRLSEPGLFVLTLSRLGYATGDSALVHMERDETRYLEIELQPEALGLPGITVTGDPQLPHLELSGFYHRRDFGRGTFLGPDEVDHRNVTQTSEYLRRVPSFRLERRGISMEPVLNRGPASLRQLNRACYPDVVVDGVRVRDGGFEVTINFDDIVAPQEVEAMEVYAGGATVPRQWLGLSGCGLVVIWTKR